ncbi:MAG: hypothetical protein ABSE73_20520, partial [Planctomycetota bacterium]
DAILAHTVLGPNDGERHSVQFEPLGVDGLRLALAEAKIRHHVGAIISVKSVVTKTASKRELGARRHALAVDMESFAIAAAARAEAGVLILRVVSDAVDDELPAEIGSFLDARGRVRLRSVARFALRGPRSLRTLLRLNAHLDKATASLTAAWRAVWAVMRR